MRSRTMWTRVALVLLPAAVLALAVACGSSENKDSSAKSATQPASSTATSGAATPAAGTATILTLVATDNKFDLTTMTVKAGQEISVSFQNKGSAIHNWHVINVKDKDGKDITSKLLPAEQSETIKFTLDKAGAYDYQCDVHPAEMKGKLTVQ